MPICINCSHPLPHLYTIYSKADDRTLGKGVRLTQCSNCKRFADKYVEHDYVVLFIDLVLIKPQVYRHLLFNRLNNTNTSAHNNGNNTSKTTTTNVQRYHSRLHDRLDPSIARLGILLVLFDVYITWARIEKGSNGHNHHDGSDIQGRGGRDEGEGGVLTNWPILGQYLFFLTLNLLSTVAQHGTIRLLARYFFSGSPRHITGVTTGGDEGPLLSHGGHSRTSSAATERPGDRDRDRDRDGASTTATTSSMVARRKMSGHESSQLHQHQHHDSQSNSQSRLGHGQYGSPNIQHDPVTTNANTHSNASHSHIHNHAEYTGSSPYRSAPSGSAISTALLVSSCTKLFPILLVIWPTTGGSGSSSTDSSASSSSLSSAGPFGSRAASYIGWVVLFNNIEALMILLQPESGYLGVTALAVAGFVVRFVVEGCLLSAVSLATDGSGPVGDFLGLLAWVIGKDGLA